MTTESSVTSSTGAPTTTTTSVKALNVTTTTTTATTKKKFGQNLNKLLAPELEKRRGGSDPLVNSNGLLVLSTGSGSHAAKTKKGTDHSNNTVTNAWRQQRGNVTEPTVAVVVAEEATTTKPTTKPEIDHAKEQPQQPEAQELKPNTSSTANTTKTASAAAPSVAWDEYGGRGGTTATDSGKETRTLLQLESTTTAGTSKNKSKETKALQLQREEELRMAQQRERAAAKLRELEARAAEPTKQQQQQLWEPPSSNPTNHNISTEAERDNSRVIFQLSSYEDRNRGENKSTEQRRMLYDPSTGKMVELKPTVPKNTKRNENSNTNSTNSKSTAPPSSRNKKAPEGGNNKNSTKKKGGATRKSESIMENKETNSSKKCGGAAGAGRMRGGERNKKETSPEQTPTNGRGASNHRHPKSAAGTAANSNNNTTGGKQRNASQEKRSNSRHRKDKDNVHHSQSQQHRNNNNAKTSSFAAASKNIQNNNGVTLYTGLYDQVLRSDLGMQQPQPPLMMSQPIEEETSILMTLPLFETVRADDKLEILDDTDTPTLKPTAKEFAPSQAALAAAAAARVSDAESSDDSMGCVVVNDEILDVVVSDTNVTSATIPGLGFDPTPNVDGLIQPSPLGSSKNDELDVWSSALKIIEPGDTDLEGVGRNAVARHIFDFGSSGTWGGDHHSLAKKQNVDDNNDHWEMSYFGKKTSRTSTSKRLFETAVGILATTSEDVEENAPASPTTDPTVAFLNIPPSDSWGVQGASRYDNTND